MAKANDDAEKEVFATLRYITSYEWLDSIWPICIQSRSKRVTNNYTGRHLRSVISCGCGSDS